MDSVMAASRRFIDYPSDPGGLHGQGIEQRESSPGLEGPPPRRQVARREVPRWGNVERRIILQPPAQGRKRQGEDGGGKRRSPSRRSAPDSEEPHSIGGLPPE